MIMRTCASTSGGCSPVATRLKRSPTAQTALAVARADRPDLVLTDVMMPRNRRLRLAARVTSRSQTAAIPVIMLSARAGEEARVEGIQSGADDYLVKPFSARELEARVSRTSSWPGPAAAAVAADERAAVVIESITDAFFALDSQWRFTYTKPRPNASAASAAENYSVRTTGNSSRRRVGTIVEHEFRRAVAEQVAVEFENYYSRTPSGSGSGAYPSR